MKSTKSSEKKWWYRNPKEKAWLSFKKLVLPLLNKALDYFTFIPPGALIKTKICQQ